MSDQPLNDAWGQGADGKWYPPEQLWGRAASPHGTAPSSLGTAPSSLSDGRSPWGAPPPQVTPRAPRWPWLAVALGGLASFVLLAILGAAVAESGEADVSARPAPSTSSELAGVTSSTTTTSTTTTSTSTTAAPTTTAPTTTVAPPPPPAPTTTVAPPPPALVEPPPADVGVYYENCAAARAAGAAPVHRGQPGYARHLDRDDDGVGCE